MSKVSSFQKFIIKAAKIFPYFFSILVKIYKSYVLIPRLFYIKLFFFMLTSTTQDLNENNKIRRSIAIAIWLISNPNPCILFEGSCEIAPEVPTSSPGLAPVPSSPGLYRSVIHILHVVAHMMLSHLPICPFQLGLTKLVSDFFGSDAVPYEV